MTTNNPRPLRIAMVCDPIGDYIAGVLVSTWRFAHLLKSRGHHIIFIAAASHEHPKDAQERGFMMYRFPSVLLPKTEGAWRIALPNRKRLKSIFLKERIDVVHLLLPMPSAFVASHVARSMGIPVIAHSHAQPENAFIHIPFASWRAPLNAGFDVYMGRLYRHADRIVFPTQFAQTCLQKYIHHKPFSIISNGVDTEYFSPADAADFLAEHSIPKDAYTILYVGRLHPEKNVPTLLRAMPAVLKEKPNAHLLVVGGGHMQEQLEDMAKELGIAKSVSFFGKIPDTDLLRAYRACQVFVLPSVAELEGMVVLEAMSCGLPIVVANAPQSASRFFVQENGFLFEPFDDTTLAGHLIALSDPLLQKQMGEKSRTLSHMYDIHESIKQLEEVYYQVA